VAQGSDAFYDAMLVQLQGFYRSFSSRLNGDAMSHSSARAFLAKIIDEEGFQKHLVAELAKKRMELIKEAGFDFSEEELEQAKADLPPGAFGHVAGWFCNVVKDQPSNGAHCCSSGLWH
jgi:predicted ribosomally synthesized peptide with nif11-like leader